MRGPGSSIYCCDCTNIVNMDGLEWKRSKYNKYVQRFLKYAEKLAAVNADALVADSTGIKEHLKATYDKDATFIPYGADVFESPDISIISKYGLKAFQYHILIARMESENNIEMIIEGVIKAAQDKPLIIVGKTENTFSKNLIEKYSQHEKIKFMGGIYDMPIINNLRYYSSLYFHGHTVGGTNPSLLEAMGCSALIAAHNNVFNKSVLGDDAFYFLSAEQVSHIVNTTGNRNLYQHKLDNNIAKIIDFYNWRSVTDKYESLFVESLRK
jgi:glycosyltransferase involved in cell wall biosynthesis